MKRLCFFFLAVFLTFFLRLPIYEAIAAIFWQFASYVLQLLVAFQRVLVEARVSFYIFPTKWTMNLRNCTLSGAILRWSWFLKIQELDCSGAL